jgi:hypothetical protein
MPVTLVPKFNYEGQACIQQLLLVREAMELASSQQDWPQVRRLDRLCSLIVNRAMAVNLKDKSTLIFALRELTSAYKSIILHCNLQVPSTAH